jgi:beta-glucosidase
LHSLAAAGIVLLKNEGNLLPLPSSSDKVKKIAIIGPNAKAKIVSGGGSASLKPSYFVSSYDGVMKAIEGKGIEVGYHQGVQGMFFHLQRMRANLVKIFLLSKA